MPVSAGHASGGHSTSGHSSSHSSAAHSAAHAEGHSTAPHEVSTAPLGPAQLAAISNHTSSISPSQSTTSYSDDASPIIGAVIIMLIIFAVGGLVWASLADWEQ